MTPEETLAQLAETESKLKSVENERDSYLGELNKLRLMQLTLDPNQFYTNFYFAINSFTLEQTLKFQEIMLKLHKRLYEFSEVISTQEERDKLKIKIAARDRAGIDAADGIRKAPKPVKGRKPLSPEAKIINGFTKTMGGILGQTQIISTLKSLPMFTEWSQEKLQSALDEINAKGAKE